MTQLTLKTPLDVRQACRRNQLKGYASSAVPGYLCVNVVMMDHQYADRFRQFCHANPKAAPLLAELGPGQTDCPELAAELDIRTDLGSYDIIEYGELTEQRQDVLDLYNDRMVCFLTGSSVSFDGLLIQKGLRPNFGPCIQITDIDCHPVDPFHSKMAVTMRIFPTSMTRKVWEFTARFPKCHGEPIGCNNAKALGIQQPNVTNRGMQIDPDIPGDRLYWACGLTPSLAARAARLPLLISYTPGHALITDVPTESLEE